MYINILCIFVPIYSHVFLFNAKRTGLTDKVSQVLVEFES